MKHFILISLLFVQCNIPKAQKNDNPNETIKNALRNEAIKNLPPQNLLQRVLRLKIGNIYGTGFVIVVKNRPYLITARHLFATSKIDQIVEVSQYEVFYKHNCKAYFSNDTSIDIAVLTSSEIDEIQGGINYLDSSDRFAYVGQQGIFLGYPYGTGTIDYKNNNEGYNIPFVKKMMFSGLARVKGVECFILDGINNPGFSGGSILFKSLDSLNDTWYVVGVVKGYIPQYNKTYIDKNKKKVIEYEENSGLFAAIKLRYVLKIIEDIK